MKILSVLVITAVLSLLSACSKEDSKATSEGIEDIVYVEIDWTDLIPDDDLTALENPPEYLTEIEDGSAEDNLPSQLKSSSSPTDDRYQQALSSKEVRPEYDGRHIRVPGFIVPLEFNDQQTITTFFLVPFFGACLHMPPPPPNQIIYAEYEPGIRLEALYDPFWIEGMLSTSLVENDMATSAYSMNVATIEPYYEDTGNIEDISSFEDDLSIEDTVNIED